MAKKPAKELKKQYVLDYVQDIKQLLEIPTSLEFQSLTVSEYPFDRQLLSLSPLYRFSRKKYLDQGGKFLPSLCSTLRALSAQDLFKDEIAYSPSESEIIWFKDFHEDTSSPELEIESLTLFNGFALYHEQNHRILWHKLPKPAASQEAICRYLNFAEALVVALDIGLGDELGEISNTFERMKVIYRPGLKNSWKEKSKEDYRKYLMSITVATYFALELIHYDDILDVMNSVLPSQAEINEEALPRALDLSELFSRVTNPLWQDKYWQDAEQKLQTLHKNSSQKPLSLPEDPWDLGPELQTAHFVFDFYGL